MKTIHFLAALIMVAAVAVFSSCSDKDKEADAAREQARLDSIRIADSLENIAKLDSLAAIADSLLNEKEKLEENSSVTRTSTPRSSSSSASTKSGGTTSQPAPVKDGPVEGEQKPKDFEPGKKGDKAESGDTDFTPGKKGEVPKSGDGEVETPSDFVPGKKK